MAFFSVGMPSVGEYLMSPVFNLAAALSSAGNGVLFLGSPMPRWMTDSPRSRSSRASSFILSVGDSAIDRANWLMVIVLLLCVDVGVKGVARRQYAMNALGLKRLT